MAIATTIDPEWQFQVNQVTRILKKYGVEDVTIYQHAPDYPNGYIIVYHKDDNIYQAAGENLAHLTETIVNKLSGKDAPAPTN